ncbi:hypothetical protein [Pyxidicoccus trucidator]|uniref:hypothetical protein n=1 Tax=Pyxidicoccus trucidator TaxID=2709662 RepID=UPI0013DCD542|nr:hypothetical protein [Pyxidicoccus trucidator]
MKLRDLPIPLDRRIPFVSAVVDVIEGRGDIATAIELLVAAELRCGVAIWTDLAGSESQMAAGSFVPVNSATPPTLRETMDLIRRWEDFERVFRSADADPRADALDAGVARLLGETHLVLSGMDFTNDTFVRAVDGTVAGWTQRAWGAFLARWANGVGWGPLSNERGKRHVWDYADFYHLNDQYIEHYTRWREVVMDVLHQKTLRAMGDAGGR